MTTTGRRSDLDTPTRILDIAEGLVQTRGFNGFSYADVAAELGITTASLHYHFAGKAELGRALIVRYTDRFMDELDAIASRLTAAPGRLQAYIDLYANVLQDGKSCLCGMLAAEFTTLPQPMQEAVISFFDRNELWLGEVLKKGRELAELQYRSTPEEVAQMIVSSLEGAMLVARPYGDVRRFQSTASQMLASLTPQS